MWATCPAHNAITPTSQLDRYEWSIARLRQGSKDGTKFGYTAMCFQSKETAASERATVFDTDSFQIGIDNRCSGCISHKITDFVGTVRPTNQVIKGFAGSTTRKVMVGTLKWVLEDDNGKSHNARVRWGNHHCKGVHAVLG